MLVYMVFQFCRYGIYGMHICQCYTYGISAVYFSDEDEYAVRMVSGRRFGGASILDIDRYCMIV